MTSLKHPSSSTATKTNRLGTLVHHFSFRRRQKYHCSRCHGSMPVEKGVCFDCLLKDN